MTKRGMVIERAALFEQDSVQAPQVAIIRMNGAR
jgi:hypothetical protein